ncbi:MAG TPA: CDP-diacylglycerol--glycerol-3-phosphate 3-phosphatidyltransferase [Burkholderiales bacterium]|nr:CDP-diacylglycerol--glycerol-3-phosphate 3-phosphatidyltransferase [Burkholderiales bacterium]
MPLNAPNVVTWLRILLIPLLIAVFYLPDAWLSSFGKNVSACAIFIVAALSDWLDGYLARALNQTSAFGAFLDPVADKLVVAAALVMLLKLGRVEPVIALIIIGREIAISALREWMARLGQSASVAVAYVGKVKTASQMVAIPLLLFHGDVLGLFSAQRLGTLLIYVAAALTVVSMVHYLRRALPYARG